MSTKRQSNAQQVNSTIEAQQDNTPVVVIEAQQDNTPVVDEHDYSIEALESFGLAAGETGKQAIISTDESAHQIAWTMTTPDSPVYRAGMYSFIAGLNAKVRQYNAELRSTGSKGKARAILNANPDVYTLVRVVTRLAVDRVKHAKLNAESSAFLIQTYAVDRSTGDYFRIPGKVSQTYDSVLFYRYGTLFGNRPGSLFVLTRDSGVFYDAMDSQHGKGFTVSDSLRSTTRTALEKAQRSTGNFTAWTPRAFNAWLKANVESGESGESEQTGF